MATKSELLTKLSNDKKARAIELENTIEIKLIENEITYVNSSRYEKDIIVEKDNKTISEITTSLDNINDKHFSHYKEFNFGSQANNLIGAIRCVMLQKSKGFQALESASFANPAVEHFIKLVDKHAQSFPDAIGRNTYFDKLSGVISHGTLGNASEAKAILERISMDLNLIDIDLSQVNQDKFNFLEDRAVLKAQTALEDNKLLDPTNNEPVADTVFKTA